MRMIEKRYTVVDTDTGEEIDVVELALEAAPARKHVTKGYKDVEKVRQEAAEALGKPDAGV